MASIVDSLTLGLSVLNSVIVKTGLFYYHVTFSTCDCLPILVMFSFLNITCLPNVCYSVADFMFIVVT